MISNREKKQAFEAFRRSRFFKDFATDSIEMMQNAVSMFWDVMIEISGKTQDWNRDDIQAYLTSLVMMAANEEDSEIGNDVFWMSYDISSAFLSFLANQKQLAITEKELAALLDEFETMVEDPDDGPEILPSDNMVAVNDNPRLPEWREYISRDIKGYMSEWLTAYFESKDWKTKKHVLSKDGLRLGVDTLTEKMYDVYRKTPKTWTKYGLRDVMIGYWIGHVDFETAEYESLVPEIAAFLDFTARNGWLNEKKVTDYKRYMAAIEPELIEKSKDSSNFGVGKTIGLEMQRQGIDLTDKAAVDNFIRDLNARGGVDALMGDDNDVDVADEDEFDLELDSDKLRVLLDQPKRFALAAEDYDPDPGRFFLMNDHLPELGDQTWRSKTAVAVHILGVQYGIRLWLAASEVALENKMDATETLGLVCEFVDLIYAQYLQQPKDWTVDAWHEFGDWLYRYSKEDNRGIRQANVLAKLALVLGEAKLINSSQAKRLAAAMLGQKLPAKELPTKVNGKVISMKQARKLLKHKKR